MTQNNSPEQHSANAFENLTIGTTTWLKLTVWRMRRFLRDHGKKGNDLLDVEVEGRLTGKVIREAYRSIDKFMARFFPNLIKTTPKKVAIEQVKDMIAQLNYTIVEQDKSKPWGAFFRMADDEAERFIHDFFPGLSLHDAKLGHSDVVLSPKFLLVSPGQRLSWQMHRRRAERWRFLSKGAYYISDTDEQGERLNANPGTIVQLQERQRHRLCAFDAQNYTLVAEIWQHTHPEDASSEKDIIRLHDDYNRTIQG